ncbi:ferredoxin [Streptomyces sp. TLI_171]|uniref:ferredoxin n=1 Tax=Streptomyces sp. TLI_171 TaxID=1938859 RepID=UPI000C198522|nr:ferredoxin [Streptomyces sp. TLI_171]RKE17440.1 ferredoxin [Streptomyces sp. TLI_171]
MNLHVDQDRCCGAGQCVLAAPELFDQREEDGLVVLLAAEPPAELLAVAEDAVAACPGRAIRLDRG